MFHYGSRNTWLHESDRYDNPTFTNPEELLIKLLGVALVVGQTPSTGEFLSQLFLATAVSEITRI
jgi:hypothetical protein